VNKLILFLILGILLISPVYAVCSETNILKRIISDCRNPDDGICDDNEYFLKDKDCSLVVDNKLRSFIFDMWFIKILLLAGIVMYFKGNPNYPVLFFVVLVILILNGQFGVFQTPTTPNVKINVSEIQWFGEMESFDQFYVVAYVVIVLLILWRIFRKRK